MELLKNIEKKEPKQEEKKDDLNLSGEFGGTKNKKKTDQKGKKSEGYILLPDHLKHPPSLDEFYPVEYDKVIYDCFKLKVIYDRERTGFEETKEFPIVINSVVGGRY